MPQRARLRNQFWAVAAGGGLAIALLGVTLDRMAANFDAVSLKREQDVVRNGLVSRIDEVGRQVVPQVVWDDAVVNLDNRLDRSWARDNIGTYLHVSSGIRFSWVLDAEDRPVYGMVEGRDAALADYAGLSGSVQRIVAQVRAAEALRRDGGPQVDAEPQTAIIASMTDVVGSELTILSATLVQPDFGTAIIQGRRAPIVITGRPMDAAFIDAFSHRYMLKDAHLHPGDARQEPGQAHTGILGPSGDVVSTLDWTPQQPGDQLLRTFMPLTMALLAGLLALALVAYRKARAGAQAVVASEQRARHIAYHDALTGLGNRHAMDQALAQALMKFQAGGPRYALHCVDLDNFKEINDISGHAVGDELLRIVARRLCKLAGSRDHCFRLDGDEFAVLQAVATDEEAAELADRIGQALAKRFALTVGRFTLTASIGVGLMEAGDASAIEVLRKADLALFSAKRDGRAQHALFDPAMDELLRRRRGLQNALRRDLQNGALTMVYQPQVDRDRNLIGVEALVRWTSEEFGPVSPAVFVPLAEETGMIEALGAFTLKRAFEDSRRWPDLKVAINVSALQLRDPGFTDRVLLLAAEAGVRPSGIELELTEGVLVERGQGASSRLDALRDAGFSIAIDDFGTGYSSLSYLSRFPIGKIKIDRSFVIDMGRSKSADALISSIVQLGRSMNMRVIAEGVETPEQWLRLAAVGCNEFQGYLASRPVSAEDIDRIYAGETVGASGQDPHYAPSWKRAVA